MILIFVATNNIRYYILFANKTKFKFGRVAKNKICCQTKKVKYEQKIILKNGKSALIRNGEKSDGVAVYEIFNLIHAETDYLLSYPDENTYNPEQEAIFLEEKTMSSREIELLAVVDGKIVGSAGIEPVGKKDKVKHRAEFGIGVLKEYWGLGVGKSLMKACIQCAKDAGYTQLELQAVSDNDRALALYRSLGFEEFGRNPTGFKSRTAGYQELVYMLLKLKN